MEERKNKNIDKKKQMVNKVYYKHISHRKKLLIYHNNELIGTFKSARQAEKELGWTKKRICNVKKYKNSEYKFVYVPSVQLKNIDNNFRVIVFENGYHAMGGNIEDICNCFGFTKEEIIKSWNNRTRLKNKYTISIYVKTMQEKLMNYGEYFNE